MRTVPPWSTGLAGAASTNTGTAHTPSHLIAEPTLTTCCTKRSEGPCSSTWIRVESKDDMRRWGLPSPDRADTLAMVMSRRSTGRPKVDVESHQGESITGDLMQKAW
jgi:hypothetical protein